MSPLRLPASYSCLKSRFCSFDLHGKSLIELAIYGDCINIIYIVQYIVEHEQPKYKCHFRVKICMFLAGIGMQVYRLIVYHCECKVFFE